MLLFTIALICLIGGAMTLAAGLMPQRSALTVKAGTVILAISGLLLTASTIKTVPKGSVGVVDVFGDVLRDETLSPGLHITKPWWNTTIKTFQLSLQTHNIANGNPIKMLAADTLTIQADATLMILPAAEHAWCVVERLESSMWSSIVDTTFRATMRDAAAGYRAEELVTQDREALGKTALELLQTRLEQALTGAGCDPHTVVVSDITIRDLELPTLVKAAVDERAVAEQQAARMVHVLERERREAERKAIEAEGIAEFQRIVSEGITPDLLAWRGIEATSRLAESPNAKVIVVGGGGHTGLPVIGPRNNVAAAGSATLAGNAIPPIILDATAATGADTPRWTAPRGAGPAQAPASDSSIQ